MRRQRHPGAVRLAWLLAAAVLLSPGLTAAESAGNRDDAFLDEWFGEAATNGEDQPPPASQSDGQAADTTPQDSIALEAEEPEAPTPERPQSSRVLEEIVVTATKRETSVRDIPASIDAFSGDDLAAQASQGFEDYIKFSPGVSFNAGRSADQHVITVRGVTTEISDALVGSFPTGIFFDDVSLMNPSILGAHPEIDAFDMSTVEVLKGPQGTLFGGSALAGAVRFVPSKPDFDDSYGRLLYGLTAPEHSAGLGHDLGLSVNTALHETLAFRLAATRRSWPGVVDDLSRGVEDSDRQRKHFGRVMLGWQPRDDLSVDLAFQQAELRAADETFVDNAERWERESTNSASPANALVNVYSAQFEFHFEHFTLTSISSLVDKDRLVHQHIDRAFLPQPLSGMIGGLNETSVVSVSSHATAELVAQELRLVSAEPSRSDWALLANWNWILGGYFQRADQFRANTIIAAFQPELGGFVDLDVPEGDASRGVALAVATEQAVFIDLIRTIGDRFELNLGGRQFQQETDATSITENANTEGDRFQSVLVEKGFNPKFALTWHAAAEKDVYLSASRGFRFGGVNNLTPFVNAVQNIPPFYSSDELWNYELGFRADWLDGRLRTDLTLFLIDWERLQIVQRTDDGLNSYIDNVGGARNRGLEIGVQALLPWGLNARFNATYLNARVTTPFSSGSTSIEAGQRLPAAPRWDGSIVLSRDFEPGAWTLSPQLSYAYHGESFNNIEHDLRLPAYQLFDFSLNLANAEAAWLPRIALVVKNLFDERSVTNGLTGVGTNPDFLDLSFNSPRTYVLQFTKDL